MCLHMKFPDGSSAIICGTRSRRRYCACGRECEFLCDWKVEGKKSGTCDAPICAHHAQQVAPEKHLCPAHQRQWEDWKRRHPNQSAAVDQQPSLFEGKA